MVNARTETNVKRDTASTFISISLVFIMIILLLFLSRYELNRLQIAEHQLKASNQQLTASEQQLKASNQQLRANELEREKLLTQLPQFEE